MGTSEGNPATSSSHSDERDHPRSAPPSNQKCDLVRKLSQLERQKLAPPFDAAFGLASKARALQKAIPRTLRQFAVAPSPLTPRFPPRCVAGSLAEETTAQLQRSPS